ncbi:MAG TPA: SAM-dependent methyltransferase [Alphaproteobacteria bacterium]|jgi:NADH dehydrogenase [ubiquinone] 1 alpha subcomplex assembly factor 7
MTPLEQIIRQCIAAEGPMGVGTFMALALGHPEQGYYMTRDPFGRAGDFTTAPEISQMFGELLGLWAADVWIKLSRPARFDFIECGPGRGTLMADALRATRKIEGFHAAAHITLMEISPVLKAKQQDALKEYKVQWIDGLNHPVIQSSNHSLILLANEFLDALPVEQWEFKDGEWQERVIEVNEQDGLTFTTSPRRKRESRRILTRVTEGDVFEDSPAREEFVRDVSIILKQRQGAALFVDYGHEGGMGDTLQAVRSHKFVPVLEEIGNADLTSHVDFAALKLIAAENGVDVLGPTGQGRFLETLGLRERAAALGQSAELARLAAPENMGRLFKAMALCHDVIPEGF